MGYIPLPEMTNIGDTRVDERKILCCKEHYFEAKWNCFYVVPFDRNDDPVDNFLTLVRRKHKRLRGKIRKMPPAVLEREEPLDPIILENFPKPKRIRNRIPKLLTPSNGNSKKPLPKIHFREDDTQSICGLLLGNAIATTNIDAITCKHCRSLVIRRSLETFPA